MRAPRPDWATICTAGAVVLVLVSNLVDIGRFHDSLAEARRQQAASLESMHRAEAQLDGLAKGTQALADQGNPNARQILAVLRQNGIQVKAGN